jgi:hypothetical protein
MAFLCVIFSECSLGLHGLQQRRWHTKHHHRQQDNSSDMTRITPILFDIDLALMM